ncbi:MAG TPA: glycosyltransferase family 1 protein [Thermoanaerobaculia bacterium]|nr:glycosyltransferase family 1 protein [Thermoanaerobaculia bacterium]
MRLVQVVPTLPPPVEGVAPYALTLARSLADRHGIESRFLVGDPSWVGGTGADAAKLPAREAGVLSAHLSGDGEETVLVHYANYAYQPRGCPAWLVDGLVRWRERSPRHRLVVVFHEVYATGLPWQSSFWLLPVQRRLARTLVRRCDAAVTSLELYVRRLGGPPVAGKVRVVPILSNIGEPLEPPDLQARAPRLLVFGGRGMRLQAYTTRLAELEAACRSLDIEEVWDVGPSVDLPLAVTGIPVRACGPLPAAEVSGLMIGARVGFLAYPPDFLAKSSVFAAYCAHGLLPVCAWEPPEPRRETVFAGLYWRCGSAQETQKIASAARTWYEGHSLSRQTEMFRQLVSP